MAPLEGMWCTLNHYGQIMVFEGSTVPMLGIFNDVLMGKFGQLA